MMIIAHRGASHEAPENTRASVLLAWTQGADAVEVDVHLSGDGEVVVIHDESLERTTGRKGNVRDFSWEDLRALDAGRWKDNSFAGEPIPLLSEILACVPQGKRLVIELKGGGPLAYTVAEVLRASSISPGQVTLISFDYEMLKTAKQAMPECPALLLAGRHREEKAAPTTRDLERLMGLCLDALFEGLDLPCDWPIDQALVEKVHQAKLTLYVYTVNDPAMARDLFTSGIDGLTTDRPGWLRKQIPF